MSDFLGQPRFKVSELDGYPSKGHRHGPGRTVTVVDRAYCSQVVKMWCTEDTDARRTMGLDYKLIVLRRMADELCAELNAK